MKELFEYKQVTFFSKPMYQNGKEIYYFDHGQVSISNFDITDYVELSNVLRDENGNVKQYTRSGVTTCLIPL